MTIQTLIDADEARWERNDRRGWSIQSLLERSKNYKTSRRRRGRVVQAR